MIHYAIIMLILQNKRRSTKHISNIIDVNNKFKTGGNNSVPKAQYFEKKYGT